jgi:hypothetical protein
VRNQKCAGEGQSGSGRLVEGFLDQEQTHSQVDVRRKE